MAKADDPKTLAEAEAARDKAVADAEAKGGKAVAAIGKAADAVEGPVDAALEAADAALEAQGDVDRAEQKVRAGGVTAGIEQTGPRFRGVPGDAWGGPTDEGK